MTDNRMTVLGTGKRYSSLDTYAEEFANASGNKRVMLRISKNQIDSKWGEGVEVIDGNLNLPITDGWAWNILRGTKIFKKLKDQLDWVHYTTFGLPILSKPEKSVITIHDLFFLDKNDEAYGHTSEKILRRFLDFGHIIAPSEWVKKQLMEYGFTRGGIKVIYMPPPKDIRYLNNKQGSRTIMGLPQDSKLVLSVSSDLKRKNNVVVKETSEFLGEEYKLVKVGAPIEGAINFSNLSAENMNHLYNACDVLLFPTLAEGYGKPVVEAFAAGLPVVVSDIPVMHEICGTAAMYVDPTNTFACVEGVEQAVSNCYEFRDMSLKASQRFSREKFSSEVKSYYAEAMK